LKINDQRTNNALIVETLSYDMIKPTIQMEETKKQEFPIGEAFSVKMETEDKQIKKLAKQNNLYEIFINWDGKSSECSFEINRLMFSKFGPEVFQVISKKHCVVSARRERRLVPKP